LVVVGGLVAGGSALRGMLPGATGLAVLGFFLLVLVENIWRPLFLDRLDEVADSTYGAAVLSVEAQFSSLGVMIGAPVIGKIADHSGLPGVGLFVMAMAVVTGALSARRKRLKAASPHAGRP
jgi:predicted MFS family arabinose efflux permease